MYFGSEISYLFSEICIWLHLSMTVYFVASSPLMPTDYFFDITSGELRVPSRSCPPMEEHEMEWKRWSLITKKVSKLSLTWACGGSITVFLSTWVDKRWRGGWLTRQDVYCLENWSYKSQRWENLRSRKWAEEKCQEEEQMEKNKPVVRSRNVES